MEFVIVTFPTSRRVFIDNIPQGLTGTPQGVQEGVHVFDLGEPVNYSPESQQIDVTGTSPLNPMPIAFVPAPLAEAAAAPARARRPTKKKKAAPRKRAAAPKRRKKPAARKKARRARTKKTGRKKR